MAYDIADNGRRARLAKMAENFMPRVQHSVFEGRLGDPQLRKLRERIGEIIKVDEDAVRIYRLCASCESHIECMGGAPPPRTEQFVIV